MKTLNTFTRKGFVINQVRYNESIIGKHYAIEITFNDSEIKTIDGLTLDASADIFMDEVIKLNKL